MKSPLRLEIGRILEILPHRYPFVLVHRVDELVKHERIVARKMVSANEPWCVARATGRPIMPGVLILEAMAQVGGVLAFKSTPSSGKPVVYLTGVDQAKFRRPVIPGDQLRFEIEVIKRRSPFWKMQGRAFVETNLVCEAEITAMVTDEKAEDVNR